MKKKSNIKVIELSNEVKIRIINNSKKVNKKVNILNLIKESTNKKVIFTLFAISLVFGFVKVTEFSDAFAVESNLISYINTLSKEENDMAKIEPLAETEIVENILPEETVPTIKEVFIYNDKLPMPKEHQEYLYNLCKDKNLDYLKTLAVLKHESQFDVSAISKSNDYGYMQVNRINHTNLAKNLGTQNKPLDAYINMNWGTYLLKEAYSYWEKQGLTGEKLDESALSTYNRGLGGFKKYGKAVDYIGKVDNEFAYIKDIFAN